VVFEPMTFCLTSVCHDTTRTLGQVLIEEIYQVLTIIHRYNADAVKYQDKFDSYHFLQCVESIVAMCRKS